MPNADAQAIWADALGEENFPASSSAAADLFLRAGDSVMIRLKSHVVDDGFHLMEQIDRNTYELFGQEPGVPGSEVGRALALGLELVELLQREVKHRAVAMDDLTDRAVAVLTATGWDDLLR